MKSEPANAKFDAEENRADARKKNSFFGAAFSFYFFISLLIIVHIAVASYLAYFLNIWKDEGSTLYTTQFGFLFALNHAAADEKQAPLYFIILSVWRMFGDSIFFARVFSIICSAAAIKFFYDLARRLMSEPAAKFFTVFFALHPYLIWASVEIRVYSLLILLSILLLKFFDAGFLENEENFPVKPHRKSQILYVLTAIFALYTNYYLGFPLVGGFIALLVLRRFRAARDYFLLMIPIGIVLLPLLYVVKQQFAVNGVGLVEEKSLAEILPTLSNQLQNFIFPLDLSPDSAISPLSRIRVWFIRLVLAAILFFLIKNKFRGAGEKTVAIGVITAIIAAFLFAAYFLLGREFVAIRHFAVIFAPFLLFLSALAVNVLPKKSLIYGAVLFALLFPYTKIYKQYPLFAKRGDWARVAQFIAQNEKPNQAIVVFPNYDALTLPFYYKGTNQVLPDKNFFAWEFGTTPSGGNALSEQIEFVISEIPSDVSEIWLATGEICQDDKTAETCRPLEKFIEAHYTVEKTNDFYSERVRLLRKK